MAYYYEDAIANGADPEWAAANLPRKSSTATYQPAQTAPTSTYQPSSQPMNRASTYYDPSTGKFEYTPQGYASGAAYEQAKGIAVDRLPGTPAPTAQQLYQQQVNRSKPIIDLTGNFTPEQLKSSYQPPQPQSFQDWAKGTTWSAPTSEYSPQSFTGSTGGIIKNATPTLETGGIWDWVKQTASKLTQPASASNTQGQVLTQGVSGDLMSATFPTDWLKKPVQLTPGTWDTAAKGVAANPDAPVSQTWLNQPAHLDQPGMADVLKQLNDVMAKAKYTPQPGELATLTNADVMRALNYSNQTEIPLPETIVKDSTPDEARILAEQISRYKETKEYKELQAKAAREQSDEDFYYNARRANEWYWSAEEVTQRQKQREESEAYQEAKDIEGWKEYYAVLDKVKLPYFANDYFNSTARFNELRQLWKVQGGGKSWEAWLASYDFKGKFSEMPPSERGERISLYMPSMRSTSAL